MAAGGERGGMQLPISNEHENIDIRWTMMQLCGEVSDVRPLIRVRKPIKRKALPRLRCVYKRAE